MNLGNFFAELKRRNVYKVAVAYAVVGWLLVQVATQVFPFFEIPNWGVRLIVLAIAIGFPISLVIAWAFELTPQGLKRTEDVDPAARPRIKRHVWIYIVIVGALLSVALFFLGRYTAGNKSATSADNQLPVKSIAVLPFENLSEEKSNAYFAEGIQDEILTRLAKVADLKVIARTSTAKFKSAPENLPDIAKQLGVLNILEGSVQKANDQVRVNVQLINPLTNAHLWAEIYDRKLTDIFAVESDIAKAIADTLQAKLTGSEKSSIAKQPTTNTEAYELYLRGRLLWQKRSGDNLPKAIAFYEQAIARDPAYATAYAGLANAYALLPYYASASQSEVMPKAREAALKALQLDPNLADAHNALGKILNFDDINLAEAAREFERAIELQPNNATSHHWYGNGPLAGAGRFEEAITESKRAVELDPLSSVIRSACGEVLYFAGRYDEALTQSKKAVALDPAFFDPHVTLGLVLQARGDLAGASAEFEKARQLSDDPYTLALLAVAKSKLGDTSMLQPALTELDRTDPHRQGFAYDRAILYLAMNKKEEALRWLEQSFADRDGQKMSFIKVDPMLAPLRGDPRFEALAQKVVGEKK